MNINPFTQKLQLGMQMLQANDISSAEKIFRDILCIDAAEVHSFHFLGICLCKKGDLADGLDLIEKSIILDSSRHAPRVNAAKYYLDVQNYERAIYHLTNALDDNPVSKEAYALIVKAYYMSGDILNAESFAKKSLQIKPDDMETLLVIHRTRN